MNLLTGMFRMVSGAVVAVVFLGMAAFGLAIVILLVGTVLGVFGLEGWWLAAPTLIIAVSALVATLLVILSNRKGG